MRWVTNKLADIGGYIPTATQDLSYNPSNELVRFLESTPAPILVLLDITLLKNSERFVRCLKEASEKYGLAFLLPDTFHPLSGISEDSKLFVLHGVPMGEYMFSIRILPRGTNFFGQIGSCRRFLCFLHMEITAQHQWACVTEYQ
jgi:hypothetical protein